MLFGEILWPSHKEEMRDAVFADWEFYHSASWRRPDDAHLDFSQCDGQTWCYKINVLLWWLMPKIWDAPDAETAWQQALVLVVPQSTKGSHDGELPKRV